MSKSSQGMSGALPPAGDGLMAEVAGWIDEADASAFSLVPRADVSLDARLALVESGVSSLDINVLLTAFPIERRDWRDWFEGVRDRWHLGTATYIHDEPVRAGKESGRLLDFVDLVAGDIERESTY